MEGERLVLSEKVVELHDRNLETSIVQFLKQKKQRNKNTYKNYCNDIEQFFKIVFDKHYKYVTHNEFNSEATSLDGIMKYYDHLYELKNDNGERLYANSTINRKQASVKSLLKFLKIKKVYHNDLSELELISNLPKETKSIEVVSFETAMQYAEWFRANERFKREEKYLIVKLAIDSGLRASELLVLKWSQFTIEEGSVLMSGYGKGNKKWIERISIPFFKELETLKSDSEQVFSLTYSDLSKMMLRAKKALGHEDRAISFHSFKKCAVSSVYKLTGDILEAQRKGRHESLDTTRIYLENEDYGISGIVSLGDEVDHDLYKRVDKRTLVKAMGMMNKDFLFILNSKIKELQNQK